MESDNETSRTSSKLKNREEFTGWKQEVMLVCMSKGDTEGIFTDAGTDSQVGYQAFNGAGAQNRRDEWNKLAKKLVGKIGNKIKSDALRPEGPLPSNLFSLTVAL